MKNAHQHTKRKEKQPKKPLSIRKVCRSFTIYPYPRWSLLHNWISKAREKLLYFVVDMNIFGLGGLKSGEHVEPWSIRYTQSVPGDAFHIPPNSLCAFCCVIYQRLFLPPHIFRSVRRYTDLSVRIAESLYMSYAISRETPPTLHVTQWKRSSPIYRTRKYSVKYSTTK